MHSRRLVGALAIAQVWCLAFLGGACARPKAKTLVEGPPLEMPAPPPHDIEANESEPPEPATEAEAPKIEDPPKPPTTLQTTPAEAQEEVERNIRSTLARAQSDLNRIDYTRLNRDARTQYDTAKSFIRDADLAVKSKNLVYAKSLADKAATLAVQLSGK